MKINVNIFIQIMTLVKVIGLSFLHLLFMKINVNIFTQIMTLVKVIALSF